MSLNPNTYLKKTQQQPSERRIPAKFYSVDIQKQIDQLRENISEICENMRLLSNVVDRLMTLYEDEHGPIDMKDQPALSKVIDAKHSPYILQNVGEIEIAIKKSKGVATYHKPKIPKPSVTKGPSITKAKVKHPARKKFGQAA